MTIQAKFELSHPGFCLDVDLDLPGQGVTVLFGPSGCGKTSLLRCMAGLNRAGVGRLIVNGETWQDGEFFLPVHRRALGYVFQEANLFAHLTIRRNLEYGQSRIAAAARRVEFDRAIELLGIAHLLERKPSKLTRRLSGEVQVAPADRQKIKKLLGI